MHSYFAHKCSQPLCIVAEQEMKHLSCLQGSWHVDAQQCVSTTYLTRLCREEAQSQLEASIVQPLLVWYAQVGYPQARQQQQEQQQQRQHHLEPQFPATPPIKAVGKTSTHKGAATARPPIRATWLSDRSSMSSGPGFEPAAPAVHDPHMRHQPKVADTTLPEPVPLQPLPRSHAFKVESMLLCAVCGDEQAKWFFWKNGVWKNGRKWRCDQLAST